MIHQLMETSKAYGKAIIDADYNDPACKWEFLALHKRMIDDKILEYFKSLNRTKGE